MENGKQKVTLSATNINSKTLPVGLHTDRDNLALKIQKDGRRSWVFRYMIKGVRREMGLGSPATVGLKDARTEAARLIALVRAGTDPLEVRKAATTAPKAAVTTFDMAAKACIAAKRSSWSNPKHAAQWVSTLETYANPIIGQLPVAEVDVHHLVEILEPIWNTKPETAVRVRARIETVLARTIALKTRPGPNPATWAGNLEFILTANPKTQRVKHHPSLEWKQVPAFIKALRQRPAIAARCLEFAILCASRSGEVRGARWPEIDLDRKVWTIPTARMKAKKPHDVPLSPAAIALLESLPRLEATDLLFPNRDGNEFTPDALTALIERMNEPKPVWLDPEGRQIVPHGFRSSFRIWAAEATDYPRDVLEHALAHQLPDKVEAAYQRSTVFPKRVGLMNDWSRFIESV